MDNFNNTITNRLGQTMYVYLVKRDKSCWPFKTIWAQKLDLRNVDSISTNASGELVVSEAGHSLQVCGTDIIFSFQDDLDKVNEKELWKR